MNNYNTTTLHYYDFQYTHIYMIIPCILINNIVFNEKKKKLNDDDNRTGYL